MDKRESMEFDVVIVGGGPAGLSAAIHLAQLSQQQKRNLNICILEKGASIGAHILSGAVLEPSALNQLIPDWSQRQAPVKIPVHRDQFVWLSRYGSQHWPVPFIMKNQGNYIISLGQFCRWLAQQAENLGINIFTGFAANKILFSEDNCVLGVQTGDMGLDTQGQATERFQPGVNLYAKQTIFAEGCRGHLSQQLMKRYHLREWCDHQTYGIGIKELWRIPPIKHDQGRVIHTIGWPLDKKTYGGSFIYHFEDNQIAIGLVIGLDYRNPYLDPFLEFQRFKTHPFVSDLLSDGECIAYGSRALNEGGLQSIPKLTFPGGMLIGCAAGFLNVGKIKGIHTAMYSGMLAAQCMIAESNLAKKEFVHFNKKIRHSSIYKELRAVRNLRPGFQKGIYWGLLNAAIDQYICRGKAPWTLHHKIPDHLSLRPAAVCKKIDYPKPDHLISFDRMTQVHLSMVKHQEKQKSHLIIKDPKIPIEYNLAKYAGPEQRYCPAGVYEFIQKENQQTLQINFTNCIHCKTCDIKDPKQNIQWVAPEGGDGPNYTDM